MSKTPKPVRRVAKRSESRSDDRSETSLLDPVFQSIRKRVGKSAQAHASAFASELYARMSEDELPLRSLTKTIRPCGRRRSSRSPETRSVVVPRGSKNG